MSEPTITCPKCKMTSGHPKDIEHRWCGNCERFHYALEAQEPLHLNAITSDLQASVRGQLAKNCHFSLVLETFTEDGQDWWRASIKLGAGVWKVSRIRQLSPTDALRELFEIVEARL